MHAPSLRVTLPLAVTVPLLVLVLARDLPAQDAPPPTKIGIVNIFKLFLNYAKVKELQTALERDYNAEVERLERQLAELEERRKALLEKGWDNSDPTFREKLRVIAQDYEEHKVMRELTKSAFSEKGHRTTEELYNALIEKIGAYAKANGFAIVFKTSNIPEETKDDKALAKKIDSKEILYHDGAIDITEAMIKVVNGAR